MGVGGQRHAPAALPPGETRYILYRRLGGLQDRSGRVRKISLPPGFDPRTIQPVASRYTDWAISAHLNYIYIYIYIYILQALIYFVYLMNHTQQHKQKSCYVLLLLFMIGCKQNVRHE
jgi:hypothetical protein